MSLLPQSPNLGNLEIVEIYVYYDQPCLFSCRNEIGQIFLAVWVDETEVDDLWLYVRISGQRLQSIRSGKIDLRDAFLKSENGFVCEVRISHTNSPDLVETIPCDNIDEDWLPESGEFVKFSSETYPTTTAALEANISVRSK